MIARWWRELALMSRLAMTCGVVVAVFSGVLALTFVKNEVDLRSVEYAARLESKLAMLVTALTGPAALGDYTGVTELLQVFARDLDVDRIQWTPARGHPVAFNGPPVELAAPAWFEARFGFLAHAGSRRILVGGTDYGEVSLRLDPRPEVNNIWAKFTVGAFTALIGLCALLGVMLLTVEQGLRSLRRLVGGVRRFEGGDYSTRVAAVGPPEIVSTIDAFNRMAERVGAGFESLRESETRNRRLAMIVEQSHESILTRDLHGTITSWNKGAERLFGWSAAEAVGKSAAQLHMEAIDDEGYQRSLARVSSAATWTAEGLRVTKAGARIQVSVTRAPLLDEKGQVIGEIRMARDITELKKAQALLVGAKEQLEARVLERTAQLALAKDESEAANRAKSAFLATMSHEIRTPMNGVVGMIDLLEQSSLRRSQAALVETIRESAYALLAIVDNVLDFSKIEAGQFQVDIEPMAVAAVVEGVCDTLGGLAGKNGVELTLFIDPAIPAQVLGDATRLRQVLFNLTGNAVKFSGDQERPGRVSVRVDLVERGAEKVLLEFEVSDNGIGMAKEALPGLFTPFTQADVSTTRRYGGTGLGLSISHRLVELMHGELAVKSELGVGSVFTLRLPVAPLPPAPGVDAEAFDLTGVRCVVQGERDRPADDWAAYLEHAGASVHRLADPAAARLRFRDCPPGLWIGVGVGTAQALDETLAEWRSACSARADLEVRFLTIGRGGQERARVGTVEGVHLKGHLLHRRALLEAVARLAGRVADEVPEAPTAEVDTTPAPLSMEQATLQGRLILVAEDNEINQKVLRQQLALLGYRAHIVDNGREALACARRGAYPLLLTDLHMPQMDGYELALAIRAEEDGQRRIPIVALTANALKGEADRCHALGMDDYMTKPVQLAALGAMLRKWLPALPTSHRLPKVAVAAAAKRPRPLDVAVLEALVGSEPQVIGELLREFRASAAQAATEIQAALQAGEVAAVGLVAHRLKSSAGAMGALALGELCAKLETAGHTGELAALGELWPAFQAEMTAVDEFLAASLQERPPANRRALPA